METTLMEYARSAIGSTVGKYAVTGVVIASVWGGKTYMQVHTDNVLLLSAQYTEDVVAKADERSKARDVEQADQIKELTRKIEANRIEQKADMQRSHDSIIDEIRSLHN